MRQRGENVGVMSSLAASYVSCHRTHEILLVNVAQRAYP